MRCHCDKHTIGEMGRRTGRFWPSASAAIPSFPIKYPYRSGHDHQVDTKARGLRLPKVVYPFRPMRPARFGLQRYRRNWKINPFIGIRHQYQSWPAGGDYGRNGRPHDW